MDAEEFLRVALRAGAQVEFVDGRMVVSAPEAAPAQRSEPEERKPRSEPSNPNYVAMKAALAKAGITSHVSHVGASLAVLHGARVGDWMPAHETLMRFMDENIDVAMLYQCSVRAVNLKHSIKVRGKRISMSTAALGGAMYAAMDQDAHLTLDGMEPIISGTAMERKAKELAAGAEQYGGTRTMEYRRVSFKEFLSILLSKEV